MRLRSATLSFIPILPRGERFSKLSTPRTITSTSCNNPGTSKRATLGIAQVYTKHDKTHSKIINNVPASSGNRLEFPMAMAKLEKLSSYGRYKREIIEDAMKRLKGEIL